MNTLLISQYSGAQAFDAVPQGYDLEAELQSTSPLINPFRLSPEQRLALRNRIDAGEVASVRFNATVFGDEPNLNKTRPRPGNLPALAQQAAGKSFLFGHWSSMHNKKGLITGGWTRTDQRGIEQLVLSHEVTDRQAMLDVVDLKVGEFSIKVMASEWSCSECGAPARMGYFGPRLGCRHSLDEVELFGEQPLELLHNAAVVEGAYRSTGILDAYQIANETGAAFLGCPPFQNPEPKEVAMGEKDAALEMQNAELQAKLDAYEASQAEMKAQLEAANLARFEAAFDVAVRDHRVTPAQKEHLTKAFHAMGAEWVIDHMQGLEPRTDIAADRSSHCVDPATQPAAKPNEWALVDVVVRSGGLNAKFVEDYKAHGANGLMPKN